MKSKVQHIRVSGLLLLPFLIVAFVIPSFASQPKGQIYIDKGLPLKLNGIAYCDSIHSGTISATGHSFLLTGPGDVKNTTLDQSLLARHKYIRIIYSNTSAYKITYALRFRTYQPNCEIFTRDSSEWIGTPLYASGTEYSLFNVTYSAKSRTLPPEGTDTIFIETGNTMFQTNRLNRIEFAPYSLLTEATIRIKWDRQLKHVIVPSFLLLLGFQLLYILIQWKMHGYHEYRFYFAYILSVITYFSLKYAPLNPNLIPHTNIFELIRVTGNSLLLLPFLFYIKFGRYFLQMPTEHEKQNRQIKIIENFVIIAIVVYLLIEMAGLRQISRVYLLISSIIIFMGSLYFIRFFFFRRNIMTNYFLTGSFFAALGHILAMSFSFIPALLDKSVFPPVMFTMIGVTLEVLMFNTAMGYKAKSEQDKVVQTQKSLIDQLRQNELLRDQIQENRDKIAKDLHDEIGASLSSIRIYSMLAQKSVDGKPDDARKMIEQINRSSMNAMGHMSDIIWSINPKNDSFHRIVERIKSYANEVLTVQNIHWHFKCDESLYHVPFSMETRQHIFLIMKEAITNQAKYSGASSAEFSCTRADHSIHIMMRDNGKGFDSENGPSGHGLENMRSRASMCKGILTLTSSDGNGTEINLQIPLP